MEWLILLLLVPVVIAPVVLLCGFAGCHKFFGIDTIYPPRSPTNLSAQAVPSTVKGSTVVLTWENTDPVQVQIERADENGDFVTLQDPARNDVLLVDGETFTDTGLADGANFTYRVRGNNGFPADDPSDSVPVRTLSTVFFGDMVMASTDQPTAKGVCLVQSISSTLLKAGGTLASLILRGPTSGGDLTLDQVYISHQATSGDPFDSAAPPVQVASAVVLNHDTIALVPVGNFVLDMTKTLLVSFDTNKDLGNLRYGTLPPPGGVTSYAKNPTPPATAVAEAALMDRTAPYAAASVLYLVHKIEVF